MSGDYFDRLDAELTALIGGAAHLHGRRARARRLALAARRSAVVIVLGLALAMTFISEFPASASGSAPGRTVINELRI